MEFAYGHMLHMYVHEWTNVLQKVKSSTKKYYIGQLFKYTKIVYQVMKLKARQKYNNKHNACYFKYALWTYICVYEVTNVKKMINK